MMWVLMVITAVVLILLAACTVGFAQAIWSSKTKIQSAILYILAICIFAFSTALLLAVPEVKREEPLCKAAGGVYDGNCTLPIDLEKYNK